MVKPGRSPLAMLGIVVIILIIIGIGWYAWQMAETNSDLRSGSNQGSSQPPQGTAGKMT